MLDYIYLRLAHWQDWLTARLHHLRLTARTLWLCHGDHADELIITPHRVYLHCTTCHRVTAGWHMQLTQHREDTWHQTRRTL
jgi:hypothetical protein